MAAAVPLLNDEATNPSACEFLPPVAAAAPVAGRVSRPSTFSEPFTSSVAAGVVVLIPTLAVLPEPLWNKTEFATFDVLAHRGSKVRVPRPLTLVAGGA